MTPQAIRTLARLAVAVGSAALTACGDGGGGGGAGASGAPPASVASATKAEGVYSGTLTGGASTAFQLIVLENDEYWSLYGTSSVGALIVSGFVQGQGASNNGAFTSASVKDFGRVPAVDASIAATYAVGTRIGGTVAYPDQSVSFAGTPLAPSPYNYASPADLAAIIGNWGLAALDGSIVALTIAADGAFAGSAGDCAVTGKFTPRPSGKNVFNVNTTFGPAPCVFPNQTSTGIALTNLVINGTKRQLVVVGVDAERTRGTFLFGLR